MRVILTFLFSLAVIFAAEEAEDCDNTKCSGTNGCYCTSNFSPIPTSQTPQVCQF